MGMMDSHEDGDRPTLEEFERRFCGILSAGETVVDAYKVVYPNAIVLSEDKIE